MKRKSPSNCKHPKVAALLRGMGASGLSAEEIAAAIGSSRKSAKCIVDRLRSGGLDVVTVRSRDNTCRYYLPELVPVKAAYIRPPGAEGRLFDALVAAGPAGVGWEDVQRSMTFASFERARALLRKAGKLHGCKSGHRATAPRYYSQPEYVPPPPVKAKPAAKPKAAPKTITYSKKRAEEKLRTVSPHWKSLPSKVAPQPANPRNVQPVRVEGMPAYDLRYQLPPDTRVLGGFATMGVGRYLEDARA